MDCKIEGQKQIQENEIHRAKIIFSFLKLPQTSVDYILYNSTADQATRAGIVRASFRASFLAWCMVLFGHCSGTIPRPTVTWPKHRPMTARQRDVQRWKWLLKTLLMSVIVVDDDVLVNVF